MNTIAEGDTRQVGLEAMLRGGYAIYAGWPNRPWPGAAAVVVSQVHIHRGRWSGVYRLNDQVVPTISAFLSSEDEWSPKPLKANANKSFQGSIVLGLGFTMSEDDAQALIVRDPRNSEVLFPYLNGEDLNSHPEQKASRWVINFWDWPLDRRAEGTWETADDDRRAEWLRDGHVPADYPARVAADFPELLAIVEEKVKPERDRLSGNTSAEGRKRRWWHYGRDAKALYHAIGRGHAFARHPLGWEPTRSPLTRVLVLSQVSKFLAPCVVTGTFVFDQRIVVFSIESMAVYAMLQSSIHEAWGRKQAASLETRLSYTPTDVFETFPFPTESVDLLAELGADFHERRRLILVEQQIGLTGLYNRLHEPGNTDLRIDEFRAAHRQIDEIILGAYGWTDLTLNHDFRAVPYLPLDDRIRYTISEDARLEILRRLSCLNRERLEGELRHAAEERKAQSADRPVRARRGKKPKLAVIQGGLF